MVVKQINKRAVAIHPKDAPLSNEEIETAGYCITPTARTMSGIITRDVFTVVPMPIEGDLRLTADQVNFIPANLKNHVVKLGDCYCCRPTTKNENTVMCCGCGSLFHRECAGNPKNLNVWQCEKHLIRTKGINNIKVRVERRNTKHHLMPLEDGVLDTVVFTGGLYGSAVRRGVDNFVLNIDKVSSDVAKLSLNSPSNFVKPQRRALQTTTITFLSSTS
jgi:hypothetical protein